MTQLHRMTHPNSTAASFRIDIKAHSRLPQLQIHPNKIRNARRLILALSLPSSLTQILNILSRSKKYLHRPQTRHHLNHNMDFTPDIEGLFLSELDELNRMAENALSINETKPSEEEITRWMNVFQYTHSDAKYFLTMQLNDVTRTRIPDSHWELIAPDLLDAGHSRDTYEHLISLKDLLRSQSSTVMDDQGKVWTLLKLEGLLRSVEKITEIAGLAEEPRCTGAEGENGLFIVVWVDEEATKRIEGWINERLVVKGKPEKRWDA